MIGNSLTTVAGEKADFSFRIRAYSAVNRLFSLPWNYTNKWTVPLKVLTYIEEKTVKLISFTEGVVWKTLKECTDTV